MKILVDMNLSPAWVLFFATHAIEAVHWSAVGKVTAPDEEILSYAERHGLIVFTHDLDFGMALALAVKSSPSIIQIRGQEVLPSAVGETVIRALRASAVQLEKGALVTIESARSRIRVLPIRRD